MTNKQHYYKLIQTVSISHEHRLKTVYKFCRTKAIAQQAQEQLFKRGLFVTVETCKPSDLVVIGEAAGGEIPFFTAHSSQEAKEAIKHLVVLFPETKFSTYSINDIYVSRFFIEVKHDN